jgi:linearmycin/streptolysin S transport system permease protein
MALIPILAMVRKDLQLFFSDRRAVIMSFAAPIAIASFFGSIFSGPGTGEPARIPVAIVDQDRGPVSRAILASAQGDRSLRVTTPDADAAREGVRKGSIAVAVIIPPGFGDAAKRAFFGGSERPTVPLFYDPSRGAELGLVRGMLTLHVMESVSREMFAGGAGRGISIPYDVSEQAITSGETVAYNGYAHSFAGMGIQFLLFATIDLGIGILLERQRGLWKRLRSAPVSRLTLLGGKALSGTLIALMSLGVSFGFAMLVFGVRIQGSIAGFIAVAIACAMMASTFGLLVAAIGRTPGGTRGVAILAVLMMVMLGGAWVPTFIFPPWLQRLTVVVPARWAVDGLDAMTWRGLGIANALLPVAVLLGFALLFAVAAAMRLRWEEA